MHVFGCSAFNEILDSVKSSENYASKLLHDVVADAGAENRYNKQAKLIEQEYQLLTERTNESLARLERLDNDLDSLRDQVHELNRQAVGESTLQAVSNSMPTPHFQVCSTCWQGPSIARRPSRTPHGSTTSCPRPSSC